MMRDKILRQLQESADVIAALAADAQIQSTIEAVAERCVAALRNGNKLLFMGNGGSAADAQHLAGEMVSRFAFERPGLPAFSLAVDTSVMTSIGNDYGYEHLFARQIEALAKPGDVLFGFSTSGRSPNILAGLETARKMGLATVGMAGNQKARITELVDYCIEIPSASTPKIQEGHIVIGHIICGLVEAQMFERPA
jgi:D-sedoheptulose 7-phosphate isomerase